jgi:hypothetical protein
MLLAVLLAQAPCLPANLAGWEARGASLGEGKAVTVPAVDPASVRLLGPRPKQAGKVFALRFTVERAGTYGLALDQAGWIDVYPAPRIGAEGMAPLVSTRHGHGPACSDIRKIVRYTLKPGAYRLVVSGLERPQAKVMLVAGD